MHKVRCEICLAEFESRRSDARTCSARCRKAKSRSAGGHLDRLERVVKNLDKPKSHKEDLDRRRRFARQWDEPINYGQKTESTLARELRRISADTKHFKRVNEAFDAREPKA
jgi:hypothetical protein